MTYTQVSDIINWLNGTLSGSTCYFFEMTISSGSVQAHLDFGELFLRNSLGDSIWYSTTEQVSGSIQQLIRNYLSFRILAVLSGNVITDGFKYRSGQPIERPQLLPIIKNMMEAYETQAIIDLMRLQPSALVVDQDQPSYRNTAPSFM
jgi:hypothetical protein